jgi:hypothetical protein
VAAQDGAVLGPIDKFTRPYESPTIRQKGVIRVPQLIMDMID